MVKIRLWRAGSRNRPCYRVVAADARAPRDGKVIEFLGHYDPLPEVPTIVIDEEKTLRWLRYGAQPTKPVLGLLSKVGIWEKFKAGKDALP